MVVAVARRPLVPAAHAPRWLDPLSRTRARTHACTHARAPPPSAPPGPPPAARRALKTKHETPKYGLIYHASLIGQAAPKFKGKISRVLAAKCALGVRVDALGDVSDEGAVGIASRAKVGWGSGPGRGCLAWPASCTAAAHLTTAPSPASAERDALRWACACFERGRQRARVPGHLGGKRSACTAPRLGTHTHRAARGLLPPQHACTTQPAAGRSHLVPICRLAPSSPASAACRPDTPPRTHRAHDAFRRRSRRACGSWRAGRWRARR